MSVGLWRLQRRAVDRLRGRVRGGHGGVKIDDAVDAAAAAADGVVHSNRIVVDAIAVLIHRRQGEAAGIQFGAGFVAGAA